MYEYTFRRITTGLIFKEFDYQRVIQDYAEQGWRLVQVFSPPGIGQGDSPNYFELIFERPVQEFKPRQEESSFESEPLLYSLDVQTSDQSIFKLSSDVDLQDLIATVIKLKEEGSIKEQDIQELVQEIKNLDLMKRMYGIRREEYLKDIRSIAEKIQKLIAEKKTS